MGTRIVTFKFLLRAACLLATAALCCGSVAAQEPSPKPAKVDAAPKNRKPAVDDQKDAERQRKKEQSKKEENNKELGQHERVEKPLEAPAKKAPAALSPEREAAALAFVREHHPELGDLVAGLKASHPQEYQRAIRDLMRASEGLTQLSVRDRKKFELDLEAWKLKSRIELLAVRLKMNAADESLRGELKQLLGEQLVVQQSQLELDRERAQARLDQIDKKIKQSRGNADQVVEKQLQMLLQEKKPPKTSPSPSGRGPG